jgi:hypothetical protein
MISSKTKIKDIFESMANGNGQPVEQSHKEKRSSKPKKRPQKKYLAPNIFEDFHHPAAAATLHEAVEFNLNQQLGGGKIPEKGLYIDCYTVHGFTDGEHVNSATSASSGFDSTGAQNSCVRHFIEFGDVTIRFQIPFIFLTRNKYRPKGNYWVYHIRFNLSEDKKSGDLSQLQKPFGHGYIGVTGRHPFIRLEEHYRKFTNGEGNLLHRQWRSLEDNCISNIMVFQITGRFETEDEMYDAEEELVDLYTLSPKGFNMIPGGKNGIKFLEKHGIANPELEKKEDLISTFLDTKKRMHYRMPHLREYKKDHFTYVSGAWINAS